ncbi:hypothetical protein ASPTUDRAFT_46246 [Aspergillus tubingensis CBS 134.48]|uniref:Uncharacterized protein n=1 Tax=Aspergillus tubingensis (strain CBS 134.48) TaxID=767770 RepID=A0A1L9MVT6_ASPTC|nr:hypothetical protein ASPTUDRAFT_46246 [Aspergillus tubingensis CBS 134.48]
MVHPAPCAFTPHFPLTPCLLISSKGFCCCCCYYYYCIADFSPFACVRWRLYHGK